MSVQSGPTFKRYAANGVTTVYAIPFLLLDAADLLVTLDGVEVVSGFVLTGVGNPSSTCTFSAAPTGDLLFQLSIPFQRLADYQENGDLLSGTLNNDLDRLWLAIKELRRDDQRALSVDPLEPEGIQALPVAALRQSRLLAFDPNGDPTPSNLTLAQLEEQPNLALAAADAAQNSADAAALSDLSAASSESGASASAALAAEWAEKAEDVPVTTGPNKYSAKHWAIKAAAALSSALDSIAALAVRVATLEGYAGTNGKSRCTAWVNFNGTGTVSIRDSYNVSSITDNGVGTYTVNFATPMVNANYAVAAAAGPTAGSAPYQISVGASGLGTNVDPTINGFTSYHYRANQADDFGRIMFSVFGGK